MTEEILKMMADYDFAEVLPIDPAMIHITEEVRAACAKNDCGSYGKNYMCPPSVGSLEHYRQVISAFNRGILFSQVHIFSDRKEYRRYNEIALGFKKMTEKLHRALVKAVPGAKVFSAGYCSICKVCGILEDVPCRFPEEAMPSLEAAGIDVVQLTKDTGFTYNHGPKSMTIIGLVLYREG
ncbi:MAG: DUF2284 domain-containing protein [Eubacterium sp.]|nr:DUF2284 domain-containing protein [Eubacterium sp.]